MTSAHRPARKLSAAGMFLAVSVLGGLLIAGLFLPLVGAASYGSKAAAGQLDNLPVEFNPPAQAQRSTILDAKGKVLAYFFDENRVYVPLSEIAPVMRQAQVAIEDHRYYQHGPLDLTGTLRAFLRNQAAGGVTQGGSSITQQYVKMVQVEQAQARGDAKGVQEAQAGTYERKIAELRYAISLERTLSKDQILERYLNIAYFGDQTYGVEAAAEHYFGTTAKKLTLSQAALLAGLVQNPNLLAPTTSPAAGLARRNVVLDRMAELGVASPAKVAKAKKVRFDARQVRTVRSGCVDTRYPFLCDFVRKTLAQTPSLGADQTARDTLISRGGLTIATAIDPKTQDQAQRAVSKVVAPTDPLISTMNMVEPGTGKIVAMAQSRPVMGANAKRGETFWNYSVAPSLGGYQGFQAGSTFKAFTAAAALEAGMPLSTRFDAKATMNFSGRAYESCSGSSRVPTFPVSNSTGTNGVMNMYRAAQRSVNTYFVQLELAVGLCPVVKMAERLGVRSSTADAPISSYDQTPSFTLGTPEVDPLSMAEAYATFASGGIHCTPVIIDTITTPGGDELAAPSANCNRVLSSEVANAMNSLLGSVMTQGTGQIVRTADGRPQAGKTGTIDSNRAVWFVGYTPKIAGAAMISVDNAQRPFVKGKAGYRGGLKYYRVPSTGQTLSGSGSGDAGLKIWKPVMEEYLADQPRTSFDPAPAELTQGDRSGRGPGSSLNEGNFFGQPDQQPGGPGRR